MIEYDLTERMRKPSMTYATFANFTLQCLPCAAAFIAAGMGAGGFPVPAGRG